ncbi:MAG TPA: FAD-dependent oxidoreductase, partial [Verrucomicrobiae bacterium]|nr:FAD-dependent oxidoreductase [Verrucomicrobiae bacterium]
MGEALARRRDALAALGRDTLDLLVVGGGINGAGIARDAAMRGLRVGLVERGDLASGTSSRSSKLIHGGLRYLEQGDVRLVLEAVRERERLQRLAPHLVRPQEFLFPLYRGGPLGPLKLAAGLWAYDLLAGFWNVRRHRMLAPKAVAEAEPALLRDGLCGAGQYWDCRTDDARLVLETALSAAAEGALIVSYAEVAGFVKEGGLIVGARVVDRLGGGEVEARARVVVNASGPWVDR